MNNKIIKLQSSNSSCEKLSNLNLKWGCIPFDQMPFVTSLIEHNPKIHDLLNCIKPDGREYEFLARLIKNNTEQNEILFTPLKDIEKVFGDIDKTKELINKYNNRIYSKHKQIRSIIEYKNHLCIKGYVDDCIEIINQIIGLSQSGIVGYTNSVYSWMNQVSYNIDCEEKKDILLKMFSNSCVAVIYGAAGTGKTFLINHISNFFNDKNKIYLANTNPAVHNLRNKISARNCTFMTISKFLSDNSIHDCDLLIIDECSTVSNGDIKKILEKSKFELLLLVGDIFQIESILFGNWFNIIKKFIPKSSILELTKPYRTNDKKILDIWNHIRNLDVDILELLVTNSCSDYLNNSITTHSDDDEIILCLNYDGIYGINNLNRLLQNNNPNPAINWGVNSYKVGDPVLFNESKRFFPLIHNNMKGKIVTIDNSNDGKIYFTIELDIAINELDVRNYDLELIENKNGNNSLIKFSVNQYPGTDEDSDNSSALVPFQVSYAVSIHKAQGLEYQSVKIVITDEIEELITHNIFYTAITRSKEKLKIYWTPEIEKKIIDSFTKKTYSRDIGLLKSYGRLK